MQIWIVEYGCTDLDDHFCAAFTTQEKAVAYAKACATEQAESDPDEQYEIEVLDETVTKMVQVNLRNTNYEYAHDWWMIFEATLNS